ncbi:SDR family oxidoreductase [Streptomyces sp. NPDC046197]|uniref:SDR family oxidoreductase n=1 Tax=Streptomyces sp. NPDC046197 TaxID=3154337 RepID=UPI0033F51394
MDIEGSVALVTGANRGIGRAFARALIEHGAAKVYAGARDPAKVVDQDVTPLRLDVTDHQQVADAAAVAGDVTVVVNNAGIGGASTKLLEGPFDGARRAMDVNYFGTWAVSRAFAPVLARNGGGALVNMLSLASWVGQPLFPGYAAAKAAQWSLTDALRKALREQGTLVVGVHAGFVDTELSAWTDAPKISAAEVAEQTVRALADDRVEVLADEETRKAKDALSLPLDPGAPKTDTTDTDDTTDAIDTTDATDTTNTTDTTAETGTVLGAVLDRWKAAVDGHRPQEVAAQFTEDAVFQGLHPYSVGRQGIADYYASQPLGLTADYRVLETRRLADDLVFGYLGVDFGFTDRPTLGVNLGVLVRCVDDGWYISHYQVSRLD